MAEIGQSKLKQDRVLWLSQAVKYDMVDFRFQTVKYNKFVSNREKVPGRGPTMKKHNEHEHAEEKQFVDQFCEVVLHGDLLDEVEDPNAKDFMPSVQTKHKAPRNMNIGIQECPPNLHYNGGIQQHKNNQPVCQEENDEIVVPDNVEKEFMKANQVYYIVLKARARKKYKKNSKMSRL